MKSYKQIVNKWDYQSGLCITVSYNEFILVLLFYLYIQKIERFTRKQHKFEDRFLNKFTRDYGLICILQIPKIDKTCLICNTLLLLSGLYYYFLFIFFFSSLANLGCSLTVIDLKIVPLNSSRKESEKSAFLSAGQGPIQVTSDVPQGSVQGPIYYFQLITCPGASDTSTLALAPVNGASDH